jgi:hypothetical protein
MSYIGKCSCIYCKEVRSVRGIHTHVERSHLGSTKYSSGNNGSYTQIAEKSRIKKAKLIEEYLKFPNKCSECNEILPYDKKFNKFCNQSCAAAYNTKARVRNGWKPSIEQRKKTSESLTGKTYIQPILSHSICPCGIKIEFMSNSPKSYCSKSCSIKYAPSWIAIREKARKNRSALTNYRTDCAFKFNLADYPDEFDFTLIESYGWYKAKNKGDNLNGVSRDHMISVKYGFENGIDPKIISHPANCRLIRHNDNVSKGKKNYISLEELHKRIEEWNLKYN